jgi:hypothetical protein
MREAAAAKYPTLVIDSLSHAWMGKGGLLDQADQKGGRFDAWKVLTPKQHALIDAILSYPGDVIVTMRTKTEYVVETNSNGKAAPRKVGLAPIQKDGVEYEFDVAGSMSVDNVLTIEKTRCPALQGRSIRHPGADVAKELRAGLSDGAPRPAVSETAPTEAPPAVKSEPRRTAPLDDTRPMSVCLADDIQAAKTVAELDAIGVRIKRAGDTKSITDADRASLRRVYGQRQAELVQRARELVQRCDCKAGCPACVGPVLAAQEQDETSPRALALRVLDLFDAQACQHVADVVVSTRDPMELIAP